MSIRETDAYAAGLIDGEGCIYVDKKRTLRIDVGVSEKGMPMLRWLQEHYGGTIRQTRRATEKWEAAFCWLLLSEKASAFLKRVLPYLQLKTEQARLGVLMRTLRDEMPRTPTGRVQWADDGRAKADELRQRIMEMNRKGPTMSSTLAGTRIAQLAADHWITDQLNLLSEAGSTLFSETWPRAGMTRNGTASRLQPLALLTGETGSGLLPTPVAKDDGKTPEAHMRMKANMPGGPRQTITSLAVLARNDFRQADGQRVWPTPKSSARNYGLPRENDRGDLQAAAVCFETEPNGGQLNPTFVEWLMGFPLGWTDLQRSETP